jgi:hypothetical protein
MIATLIRKDPAVRMLPKFLALSFLVAAFVLNIVAFQILKDRAVDATLLITLLWLAPALYLLFGDVGTRCNEMDLALPISTRRLWLAHVAAVLVAGLVVVAVTSGVVTFGMFLLGALFETDPTGFARMGGLVVQLVAALALAVALLQTTRSTIHKLRRSPARIALTIIAVSLGFTGLIFLTPLAVATAGIPLGLAIAIGFWNYRRVPRVFSLVPATANNAPGFSEADHAAFAARPAAGRHRFEWLLNRSIFRSFFIGGPKKLTPWLTFPLTLVTGLFLSGIDANWVSSTLRFAFIPMAAYILITFSAQAFVNLHFFDSLPIARHRILAVLVIPYTLALALAYGLGNIGSMMVARGTEQPKELIRFVWYEDENRYVVRIPIEYCRVAWGDSIAEADSPWGETQHVWRTPLHTGSGIKLYMPATIGSENSIDFAALQLSRATELVYGRAVPPDEIKDRYLLTREGGGVGLQGDGLTIAADYPHLRPLQGGPLFPVILALVLTLWLLLLCVYLAFLRAGMTKGQRTAALWSALALALVLWIGQFFLAITGFMNPDYVSATVQILVRDVGSTPLGTALLWGASLLVVAAAYALALSRVRKVEAPYGTLSEEACYL